MPRGNVIVADEPAQRIRKIPSLALPRRTIAFPRTAPLHLPFCPRRRRRPPAAASGETTSCRTKGVSHGGHIVASLRGAARSLRVEAVVHGGGRLRYRRAQREGSAVLALGGAVRGHGGR
jgi:hypothetical protein